MLDPALSRRPHVQTETIPERAARLQTPFAHVHSNWLGR